MQVGVEIGGTFTDLVASTPEGIRLVKVPSTPAAPDDGALDALGRLTTDLAGVGTVVHGSTVATNAVLERAGSRGALLVTGGFGDLLELQRQDRSDPYALKYTKPRPLVARADVYEIGERIAADGEVIRPLDGAEVDRVLDQVVASGVGSVTVCFLHSYRFPAHERLVAERAVRRHPQLAVTLSHEISPEGREYERASTAVLSGYVQPAMERYLARMQRRLAAGGFTGDLHVMQSNGGALPADLISRHAVRTLLSGPAGGITAARAVAAELGIGDLLTFDMGGTSTDVALVRGGRADVRTDTEIDRLPIRVPMLDIVTVGSGGGSIASVDAGGLLRVGPRSAGAVPGPACYGRGGVEPTTTDANVVLGMLRAESNLAGTLPLDAPAAHAACARLGDHLGVDAAAGAARAVVDVANASIKAALRLASTERGVDPEAFWLFTYGGAGGQHAVAVAEDLGLRGVVVPAAPGLFSAYGLLIADIERDWSRPISGRLAETDPTVLAHAYAGLCAEARAEFETAGVDTSALRYASTVQLRYPGQAFELDVDLTDTQRPDVAKLADAFHDLHRDRYGHASPGSAVEVVSIRVTATSHRTVDVTTRPAAHPAPEPVVLAAPALATEPVTFVHRDAVTAPLPGPAVVEEQSSTTWVPPGWVAEPHPTGHLLVTRTRR